MKESTKEYLAAGAIFTWGVAKGLAIKAVNRSANTSVSTAMTSRSVQKHWDRAVHLREIGK